MARAASPLPVSNFLDRPPAGWFVLDIMRTKARSRHWAALMVDVHPAFFTDEYHPDDRSRTIQQAWVRVPGKHRNKEAAWDAMQDMLATRH